MDSILTSVKKLLGIAEDYTHFDIDIIMHINTVFMELNQIGVGPEEGFAIEDKHDLWSDFIPPTDTVLFEGAKSYMALRVRLLFDPPLNAAVIESINRQVERLEWRLNVAAELPRVEKPVIDAIMAILDEAILDQAILA